MCMLIHTHTLIYINLFNERGDFYYLGVYYLGLYHLGVVFSLVWKHKC